LERCRFSCIASDDLLDSFEKHGFDAPSGNEIEEIFAESCAQWLIGFNLSDDLLNEVLLIADNSLPAHRRLLYAFREKYLGHIPDGLFGHF